MTDTWFSDNISEHITAPLIDLELATSCGLYDILIMWLKYESGVNLTRFFNHLDFPDSIFFTFTIVSLILSSRTFNHNASYVVSLVLLCVIFFSTSPKKEFKIYILWIWFLYFFLPMDYSSCFWSEMNRIACVLLVWFHPFSFGQKPINAIFTKARIWSRKIRCFAVIFCSLLSVTPSFIHHCQAVKAINLIGILW